MKVKTKLALLELLGGLFGWLWLIAGFAGLIFLVGTLFFGWPWSRFFGAFGISVVGKWMLRGFQENQRRVYMEAVERGELPRRP